MAPTSLDPNADTTVFVVQKGPVKFKKTEFKVLAAAISISPYWKTFLRNTNGGFGFKPNKVHIEDTGVTVVAVEIVLRGLHQAYHRRQKNSDGSNKGDGNSVEGQVKNSESVTTSGESSGEDAARGFDAAGLANRPPRNAIASAKDTEAMLEDDGAISPLDPIDLDAYFPQELLKADIDDIWGVFPLLNLVIEDEKHKGKFDVDWLLLKPWFLKWREISFKTFNTQADFEKVLFPAFAFNDPVGFRQAIKWLCQRTSVGNIAENSPLVNRQGASWYLHLHLSPELMSQIRTARSQLRAKVSNQVWNLIRGHDGWLLHSDKCACWVTPHYNYLKALAEAGVLCPELDHKKPIMELVRRMKTVEYNEPLNACIRCSIANITRNLKEAIDIGSTCKGISIPELLEYDERKKLQKKLQMGERMDSAKVKVSHKGWF